RRWLNRLFGNQLCPRLFAADTDRRLWRAGAANRVGMEHLLDNSVLQRVEGDDAEPAARVQPLKTALDALLEVIQLVVDLDADCLKGLLCRMSFSALRGHWQCLLNQVDQLKGSFHRLFFP